MKLAATISDSIHGWDGEPGTIRGTNTSFGKMAKALIGLCRTANSHGQSRTKGYLTSCCSLMLPEASRTTRSALSPTVATTLEPPPEGGACPCWT